MSDQQNSTLINRIGNWFKKTNDELNGVRNQSTDTQLVDQNSTSFLRPWAKRDAAIQNLQDGFHTLTDLMSSVRDNLERSSLRQDELLNYLSHLPEALQSLPESNRIHNEALKAIHQQLTTQNGQQARLADILEKLNTKGLESGEVLDEVRERVEAMRQTDETIASNLSSFGDAMQTINQRRNQHAGARTDARQHQLPRRPARTHPQQAEFALHDNAGGRHLPVDRRALRRRRHRMDDDAEDEVRAVGGRQWASAVKNQLLAFDPPV